MPLRGVAACLEKDHRSDRTSADAVFVAQPIRSWNILTCPLIVKVPATWRQEYIPAS